jgi:hypothetical protein
MAAPVVYRSTDSSAPVLTGTAGDIVNLLDKCLVAGYGAKAAAGWTKPFTATNAAVFRMGAGNQFYLDVNDNGASNGLTGASGQEAAIRGYEVMTAASTGTNPFPTTAQVAAATSNWRKSATANATARGWFMVADDRSFILGILDGDTANIYKPYTFGDVYSLKSGDAYRTAITVRTVVNSTAATGLLSVAGSLSSQASVASTGLYIARIAAGTGTSHNPALLAAGTAWETFTSFTASLDGNVQLSRLTLADTTPILRGYLRGLWEVLAPVGLTDGDTWSGTGDLAGRSFVVVKGLGSDATPLKCLAIETTAWDSSS